MLLSLVYLHNARAPSQPAAPEKLSLQKKKKDPENKQMTTACMECGTDNGVRLFAVSLAWLVIFFWIPGTACKQKEFKKYPSKRSGFWAKK